MDQTKLLESLVDYASDKKSAAIISYNSRTVKVKLLCNKGDDIKLLCNNLKRFLGEGNKCKVELIGGEYTVSYPSKEFGRTITVIYRPPIAFGMNSRKCGSIA